MKPDQITTIMDGNHFDVDQYERDREQFERRARNESMSSFDVIPNHPAMAYDGEAALLDQIEPEADDGTPRTVEGLLAWLIRLAGVDPLLPGLVVLRLQHPDASIREICPRIRLSKSRAADVCEKLVKLRPELARFVYGDRTKRRGVQKARRRREGAT